MTKTIFKSVFTVGFSVLLLCALLFFGLQYRKITDETYSALQQETVYAENGLLIGGKSYLEKLGNINSITWIAADGSVLYDNTFSEQTENQRDYPEIRSAFDTGKGKSIRKSSGSGKNTMYYALLCPDGTVLRLGRPFSAVQNAFATVSPVLWVIVLVLMISSVLAFRAAKQIVQPINAIDLDDPSADIYPELSPLIGRIQMQNLTIQEQIVELKNRQEEFSALTESMSEGFLLLDADCVVLSVNATAQQLLTVGEIGETLVLRDDMQAAVRQALGGQHTESMFNSSGQTWELIANPVTVHGKVSGAVVLLVNVTEREQRERLRQEFSANVSHELKTPLTAISGFAELLAQGLVPAEKSQEFAADIYKEAQRLIVLIDDIIQLSKLDEGGLQMEWAQVDLYELAESVSDALRAAAGKKQVTLQITGEHCSVRGVYQILYEMLYNLCDNAIKYNKDGGSVTVQVIPGENSAVLSVADTGIGIPYSEQNRVFERFYRVDKSHSKAVGGTGLGLSIVKHGAQIHHCTVNLDSTPDAGTTIRLEFSTM